MGDIESALIGLLVPALVFLAGFVLSLAAGTLAVKALEDHASSHRSWGMATLPGIHIYQNGAASGIACRFCGQDYTGRVCPHCGGPRNG